MQGHLFPGSRSMRRETVRLHGRVNLGATGAVSTQTKKKASGFAMARTGVGTYTITLTTKYSELLGIDILVIGANATYTAANGRQFFVTSDLTTTTGVITVKFLRTDTGAVAEIEDSAKLCVSLTLSQTPADQA